MCDGIRGTTAWETAPSSPSVAAACHLACRNLVAGLGPLAVAALAEREGLQHALLLVPACYTLSGIGFYFADYKLQETKRTAATALGKTKSMDSVKKKSVSTDEDDEGAGASSDDSDILDEARRQASYACALPRGAAKSGFGKKGSLN